MSMESRQTPKYHIAPNFSIPPLKAGGILQLGSIIANVDSADEPLNKNCHVHIPYSELFCGHQTGFAATRSRMISGEYGVWAKIVGIDGVGGELSFAHEKSVEDIYTFRGIDTIYFNPSQEYMAESMNQEDVKDHVTGSGYNPVYMVTGLKTAKGPSVRMLKGRKLGVTAELGAQDPIELGPRFNTSKEVRQEMGFEDSTDFIIGIRIKKLMYEKHWLRWLKKQAPEKLVATEHNKGATMVDNDMVKKSGDRVIDLGDDTEGEIIASDEIGNESPGIEWVMR